jgi:hypothetical protein
MLSLKAAIKYVEMESFILWNVMMETSIMVMAVRVPAKLSRDLLV